MTIGETDPLQFAAGDRNVQIARISNSQITVRIGDQPPRSVGLRPGKWDDVTGDVFGASSLATLLQAAVGLVPFDDAAGVLTELTNWARSERRAAMVLLSGAAGTGKTRLAGQLCADLEKHSDRRWLTGFVRRRVTADEIEMLAATPTARLVVVDYAEARPTSAADLVTRLAATATAAAPLRIVLLTRARVRGSSDIRNLLMGPSAVFNAALDTALVRSLSLLTWEDRSARRRLFQSGAAAIAMRLGRDVPGVPTALDGPAYDRPLTIIAAAGLSCVDERELPRERRALLDRLMFFEDEHWQRTAKRIRVKMSDPVRRQTAAFAALAGCDDKVEGAELLGRLPQLADSTNERRYDLSEWFSQAYDGPRYWNKIEPDLVGEHVVATAIRDDPDLIATVLRDRDAIGLQQPIELLARAAPNYSDDATSWAQIIGEHFIDVVNTVRDQASVRTLDDLLKPSLADSVALMVMQLDLGFEALSNANDQLVDPNVALGPLQVAIGEALVDHFRQLADDNPAMYQHDLATSIHNLAIHLGSVRRREEAVTFAEEAVSIHRQLSKGRPAVYQPHLAATLHTLGVALGRVGRRNEALAVAEEGVRLYRQLVKANPAEYLPDLARSANNFANRLAEMGRHDEALTVAEEAVSLYRRLVKANPAEYLPSLATSADNFANRLAEMGRHDEALTVAEEAVSVLRRLAEGNPGSYLSDFAMSIHNIAMRFSQVGRRDEAVTFSEEAVSIRRQLADDDPAAYLPDLAGSLVNFVVYLGEVGRRDEAVRFSEEAVSILRQLADDDPAAYLPDLAKSLVNFAICLGGVGRRDEAVRFSEEAVSILRQLAENHPAAYLPDLARSVGNHATTLSVTGRHDEALTVAEEAVNVWRQLAEANPRAYVPHLATSVNNLAIELAEVGRSDEALNMSEEAVSIRRQLAATNPAAYLPDLGQSVSNLAIHLGRVGRRREALAFAEEAADVWRQLAKVNPTAFLPDLARSLDNLANCLTEVGRRDDASAIRAEASTISLQVMLEMRRFQ